MNLSEFVADCERLGVKIVDGVPQGELPATMKTFAKLRRKEIAKFLTPPPEPEDERWTDAYWQRRTAELVAHPIFPPDAEMPAAREWLKIQEIRTL